MSEYKYKEEIMDDVSFEPAFQYPHELNTHNAKVEEIKEVYVKASLWNTNKKWLDEWQRKAQAFDAIIETYKNRFGAEDALAKHIVFEEVENAYMESGDRS